MNNLEKFNELLQLGYAHVAENVEAVNGKWVRKAHISVENNISIPGTTVFMVADGNGKSWEPVASIEEARDLALKLA